jgi:hypothetical protein
MTLKEQKGTTSLRWRMLRSKKLRTGRVDNEMLKVCRLKAGTREEEA